MPLPQGYSLIQAIYVFCPKHHGFKPWSENGFEFWTFWPKIVFFSCLFQIGYRYRFFFWGGGGGLIKMVAMATNNMNELAGFSTKSSFQIPPPPTPLDPPQGKLELKCDMFSPRTFLDDGYTQGGEGELPY